MRYKYDETQQKVKKIHSEVVSSPNLILKHGTTYFLHSIINHNGENTQSGHYNVLLFQKESGQAILLDDVNISNIEDGYQQELETLSYICVYTAE